MYQGDSFLTLGAGGRVGLILLSLCLVALMLWMTHVLGRGRHLALRLPIALALFWGFLWLSPQIYYLYYIVIFEGLPWQNVVKVPPGPSEVVGLLTFTEEASLSNHGKGLLGWAMMAVGFARRRV